MSDDWLIQWLRNPSGDVFPRCAAAADRIEALERRAHNAEQTLLGAHYRIEALEAALREIGYGDIGHGDVWDIARRALEAQLDVTAENIVGRTETTL